MNKFQESNPDEYEKLLSDWQGFKKHVQQIEEVPLGELFLIVGYFDEIDGKLDPNSEPKNFVAKLDVYKGEYLKNSYCTPDRRLDLWGEENVVFNTLQNQQCVHFSFNNLEGIIAPYIRLHGAVNVCFGSNHKLYIGPEAISKVLSETSESFNTFFEEYAKKYREI